MSRRLSQLPLPTALVAALVLVLAVSIASTAGYAAGKASGNKIIKRQSLSGNRLKPDTVTGAQVAEATLGQVPSAATAGSVTQPTLVPLDLPAGSSVDPGFPTPVGFWKDASGFVHLQGVVANAAPTVVTLPPGARPATSQLEPALTGNPLSLGAVEVRPDGRVVFVVGSSTRAVLNGIAFHADQ